MNQFTCDEPIPASPTYSAISSLSSSSSPSCLSTRTSKIKVEVTPATHRWSCQICPRRFVHQSSLRRHTATHSGLRKYRCETCDKSFQQSSTLKSHMRTHSGVKPFACRVCGMSFSQGGYRNQHEIKAHRASSSSPAIRIPPKCDPASNITPHIVLKPPHEATHRIKTKIPPQIDDPLTFPSHGCNELAHASSDQFFDSIRDI